MLSLLVSITEHRTDESAAQIFRFFSIFQVRLKIPGFLEFFRFKSFQSFNFEAQIIGRPPKIVKKYQVQPFASKYQNRKENFLKNFKNTFVGI